MASVTLAQLREDLARRLGDHWEGTLTAGGATTVTDATRRTEGADFWLNAYLKVSTQERRVTASTTGGVLTVEAAFSPAVTAVAYELHRLFQAADYDAFIVMALRHLTGKRRLLDHVLDTSLSTVADQRTYTLPAGFVALERVEVSTNNSSPDWDEYSDVPADLIAIRRSGSTRQLVFRSGAALPVPNYTIRLTGLAEFTLPSSDSDAFLLDPAPVIARAAYLAAGALAATDPSGDWARRTAELRVDAEELEREIPQPQRTPLLWVEEL